MPDRINERIRWVNNEMHTLIRHVQVHRWETKGKNTHTRPELDREEKYEQKNQGESWISVFYEFSNFECIYIAWRERTHGVYGVWLAMALFVISLLCSALCAHIVKRFVCIFKVIIWLNWQPWLSQEPTHTEYWFGERWNAAIANKATRQRSAYRVSYFHFVRVAVTVQWC